MLQFLKIVFGHIPDIFPERLPLAVLRPSVGTLDDKIELNRRMNETLEAMTRAVFQDGFVDFGPVRAKMEGREPYLPSEVWSLFPERLVESELGEVPEGWWVQGLGEVVEQLLDNKEPSVIAKRGD